MVYAQIVAVWGICLGVVILIGDRVAEVRRQKREDDRKLGPFGQPACPHCGQLLSIKDMYEMPHVCPPEVM